MKKFTLIIFLFTLVFDSQCYAIGLGDIEVNSYINQPFRARIDLLDVAKTNPNSIKVSLASLDDFKKAGIERAYVLNFLSFQIISNHGKSAIEVTSNKRISDPYLELLLDLTWPNGQVFKKYVVLLDPMEYQLASVHRQSRVDSHKPQLQSLNHAQVQEKGALNETNHTRLIKNYGPTKKNDDIWQIAHRIKSDAVSMQQLVLGIVGANEHAFEQGNLNALKADSKLKITDIKTLQTIPQNMAILEVAKHDEAYKAQTTINHELKPPYYKETVVALSSNMNQQPLPSANSTNSPKKDEAVSDEKILSQSVNSQPAMTPKSTKASPFGSIFNAVDRVLPNTKSETKAVKESQVPPSEKKDALEVKTDEPTSSNRNDKNQTLMIKNKALSQELARVKKELVTAKLNKLRNNLNNPTNDSIDFFSIFLVVIILIFIFGILFLFYIKRQLPKKWQALMFWKSQSDETQHEKTEEMPLSNNESTFIGPKVSTFTEIKHSDSDDTLAEEAEMLSGSDALSSQSASMPPLKKGKRHIITTKKTTLPTSETAPDMGSSLEDRNESMADLELNSNESLNLDQEKVTEAHDSELSQDLESANKQDEGVSLDDTIVENEESALDLSSEENSRLDKHDDKDKQSTVNPDELMNLEDSTDENNPKISLDDANLTNDIGSSDVIENANDNNAIDFNSDEDSLLADFEEKDEKTLEINDSSDNADNNESIENTDTSDEDNDYLIEFETASSKETETSHLSEETLDINSNTDEYEQDLNSIEFEIEDTDEVSSDASKKSDEPLKSEKALDTLLDLAETYISMEDFESAQQSLEEVIEFGTDTQKDKATKLLHDIKNK